MEYEADGSFWLADPDESVRGRLKFTQQNGGELRLEHILAGPAGEVMPDADVMHGTTIDGTKLALINAFPVGLQIVVPKPSYPHRFFVNRLLIGTHDGDQPVERLRVAISDLLDFTATSGLSITEGGGSPGPGQAIEIAWEPVTGMPRVEIDGDEIELIAEHRFRAEDYEFCLEHRVEVELRGPGRTFEEWHPVSGGVVGFLCFFLGYPTKPERLWAPLEEQEIEEVFQHRDGVSQPKKGGPWLTLGSIEKEFEDAMRGWFAFAGSDPEVFELLGEYLRFPGRLLNQDRLLYLARIIELYYRGGDRFVQTLKPKDEHKARKKAALEAVPEADRDWVARSLARSNEKTLRERIHELVESFEGAVSALFADLEEFAAIATDNRNYYTHYSERTKEAGRVVEGYDLYELVERLFFLVRACVLREMGFANERIEVLLKEDRAFRALAVSV